MEKSLLDINFDSEPVYGDNVKYIKKKKNHMVVVLLQIFRLKYAKRQSTIQVFINNNARFCNQSKEKALSSNTFATMQI